MRVPPALAPSGKATSSRPRRPFSWGLAVIAYVSAGSTLARTAPASVAGWGFDPAAAGWGVGAVWDAGASDAGDAGADGAAGTCDTGAAGEVVVLASSVLVHLGSAHVSASISRPRGM